MVFEFRRMSRFEQLFLQLNTLTYNLIGSYDYNRPETYVMYQALDENKQNRFAATRTKETLRYQQPTIRQPGIFLGNSREHGILSWMLQQLIGACESEWEREYATRSSSGSDKAAKPMRPFVLSVQVLISSFYSAAPCSLPSAA